MRHERTMLAMAFLLGAALRLPGLAAVPLGPDEAEQAWSALRAAQGDASSDGVASAFLASAQAGLFALVEPDTFLARLPAALCGLALLAVPLLARDALGSPRMLALVWLLALDPTLVRIARDASGPAASVLAAALAVAAILRWREAGRVDAARAHRWAVATTVALGVMVTTGPDAWSCALPVALVAFTLRPWRFASPRGGECAAVFFASALLCATSGLWAVPWAAAVSSSLTAWLGWLAQPAALGALPEVARAAPLTALLALLGLAHSRQGRATAVLALAWGLVLAARSPSHPAVLALVLAWCASGAVGLAIEGGLRGWSARAALAAGALALAVQLGSAARPVMPAASLPARPGLEALASDLERIAVLKGREATEMPTVVLGEGEDRALRWALRRARSLRQSLVRPPQAEDVKRPALVLLGGGAAATPPVGYVGTTYGSAAGPVHLWVPID